MQGTHKKISEMSFSVWSSQPANKLDCFGHLFNFLVIVDHQMTVNMDPHSRSKNFETAGSEIALSWLPMRLKNLHWQPEFHNWSPAGD